MTKWLNLFLVSFILFTIGIITYKHHSNNLGKIKETELLEKQLKAYLKSDVVWVLFSDHMSAQAATEILAIQTALVPNKVYVLRKDSKPRKGQNVIIVSNEDKLSLTEAELQFQPFKLEAEQEGQYSMYHIYLVK